MKNLTLSTILFLFVSLISNAQCDCETIYREDGKIVQCNPSMIASDNSSEVGIALASNGQNIFITVAVRFKTSALEVKDKLHLRLENNQLLSFELINSGLAYIGNSEVSNAVYQLNPNQAPKLKLSKLSTISVSMSDNKLHTYQCHENLDVLIKQFKCL